MLGLAILSSSKNDTFYMLLSALVHCLMHPLPRITLEAGYSPCSRKDVTQLIYFINGAAHATVALPPTSGYIRRVNVYTSTQGRIHTAGQLENWNSR